MMLQLYRYKYYRIMLKVSMVSTCLGLKFRVRNVGNQLLMRCQAQCCARYRGIRTKLLQRRKK